MVVYTCKTWRRHAFTYICFLVTTSIVASGWSDPETVDVSARTQSDLRARREALEQTVRKLRQSPRNCSLDVWNINYPLLLLKIEKAKLLSEKHTWYPTTSRVEWELKEGETLVRLIEQNRAAYANMTGYQERAYICPVDDSVQPYTVFLPQSYVTSASRKFPVVIFLHGYDTSLTKADTWTLSQSVLDIADRKGFIIVTPYGRRNTDFVSIGEVDVLSVTEWVKRLFRVDEDRIYLMGVSMGGYGAYAIGLHYPDLFAAISAVAGRTDHYFWQNLDRAKVAPFKQWLIDADNPLTLTENARNLPMLIIQGENDRLVDIEHSRRMVEALTALGYNYRFDELDNEDHWIYFDNYCYEASLDWFSQFRRDTCPKVITHRTFSPKYGKAYWTRITALREWGQPATLRAEVPAENVIEVTTQNVASLVVTFPVSRLNKEQPVSIRWNGEKVFDGKITEGMTWDSTTRSSVNCGKKPNLSGPIKEAFNSPFMLVYGTGGNESVKMRLRDHARRMADEWERFADGRPPLKSDREVTAEDISLRNLILVGDARQNSIVGRIAGRLPLQFREGEYRVLGKTYRGDKLGFLMIYPNPLSSERYVVVQSGLFWGDALPINHKFDLLPDFIVYDDTVDPSDKTNRYLCAGFFDNNWSLDAKLIWYGGK